MSDLTSADFDRLDQLTAMLAAIPKVTAAGRKLLSAEQNRDALVRQAEKAKAEAESAKEDAIRTRDEIAKIQAELKKLESHAQAECANIIEDASVRAKSMVAHAQATAAGILVCAHDEADAAKREAATIRATISGERAELSRLETKAAKIRDQLKKMIGE